MKIRRSAASLAVAVTALAGIALTPGTASASTGGGCGTTGSLKSCISASGKNVAPDFYIIAPTPGCTSVEFYVYDETSGATKFDQDYPCILGHIAPIVFAGTNGHRYGSTARELNGSNYYAFSPILTFSG
ncbi:hypothetical protein SAMN05216223_12420 [Actinacidiphila yanglinensis]|uniref:Uncharacterized protein n=1 Tax=Actinacidiphila yanglinensis TaxID=310779 RepID=A0A1H6E3K0_9ACTN|nr:hypothetical protein [Actinacidiphila yanglinensis]SEG91586.1 hypothetical protein SAMN05216223_12420 [Actinacidiphila yanglinensis]